MIGAPFLMNFVILLESTNFEILFVIYALGILLCPSAGIKVSDAVLKVIVATKEAFEEYDWCTFVLNELCNSIGEYKKKLRKGTVAAPITIRVIYAIIPETDLTHLEIKRTTGYDRMMSIMQEQLVSLQAGQSEGQ
ncbi:hypothetical protein K1719_011987 [Acacia pycnantha]|nr:hypothetical protein K1719_011987 [Acacia pycnantha]